MTATRSERRLALLVGGGLAAIFMIWGAVHVAGWTLGTASRSEHRVIRGPVAAVRIEGDGRDDVVIAPASGPDVTVDSVARGTFRPPRMSVDVTGSTVSVHGGCHAVWLNRCDAAVTVHVPPGTPVEVSSRAGDVTAAALSGPVKLSTGSGDVDASDLSGPVHLRSSSGDLAVHGLSGTATLEASSGDIEADDLSAAAVRARTGSGDIDLVFSVAPDHVDARTGSGDVGLLVPRAARYAVDAENSSGDRVIGVPTSRRSGHVLRVGAGSGDITVLAGR